MSVDYYILGFAGFVMIIGTVKYIYFVGKGKDKQEAFDNFQEKIGEFGLKAGDNLDNKGKFLNLTK